MAPKRALYGDVSAARAGIIKRPEDSTGEDQSNLPIPPTPAALSPNSSSYTSPIYSPESVHVPSPLVVKKPVEPNLSFIKQLTRSLAKNTGGHVFEDHELQDMRKSSVSLASNDTDDQNWQAYSHPHIPAPRPTYLPLSTMSPITPTSPTFPGGWGVMSYETPKAQLEVQHLEDHQDVKPLSSMVPGESSTHMGRMGSSQSTTSANDIPSKPYYDDVDSLYASSSVYTKNDQSKPKYRQSYTSERQSNPFARHSVTEAGGYLNVPESLYDYSPFTDRVRPTSTSGNDDAYYRSNNQEDVGADTISKFIENYRPHDVSGNFHSERQSEDADPNDLFAPRSDSLQNYVAQSPRADNEAHSIGQFEFGLDEQEEQYDSDELVNPFEDAHDHATIKTRNIGSPPHEMGPPAPSFEYDDIPFLNRRYDLSEVISNMSSGSYGETRNLLQISQFNLPPSLVSGASLQPSSSYSQPEGQAFGSLPSSSHVVEINPGLPRDASDQAEYIFEDNVADSLQRNSEIPAIWTRRSSVSLMPRKKQVNNSDENVLDHEGHPAATGVEEDKADWETLAEHSQDGRNSTDSIADYSSSEGSVTEFGIQSQRQYPSPNNQNDSQDISNFHFPGPVRSPLQASASSPPDFKMRSDYPHVV